MLLAAALIGALASAQDAGAYAVFVKVDSPPGEAEREILREHGIDGFAVAGGDASALREFGDAPWLLLDAVDRGELALSEATFDRAYQDYFWFRTAAHTVRPYCPRAAATRSLLNERAAAAHERLGPLETRPWAVFLAEEPSWSYRSEPFDTCACDACAQAWSDDLVARFGSIDAARAAFGLDREWPEPRPWGVDAVRVRNAALPRADVRLGPWLDARAERDRALAAILASLAMTVRGDDASLRVGILGGALTNPFGGHDWSRLGRSLDALAPPDDPTSREVVASVGTPSSPVLSRLVATGGSERFARKRLVEQYLRGARGAIVEDVGQLVARGEDGVLRPTQLAKAARPAIEFLEGEAAREWNGSEPLAPRAGILYSPRSVKVLWLLESAVDGLWWPARGTRREGEILPLAGAWWGAQSLLVDLGLGFRYVPEQDLAEREDALAGLALLVLPRAVILSQAEAEKIESFVARGGRVLADAECGLFDENGRGRSRGILDGLLGIERADAAIAAPWDAPAAAAIERVEPSSPRAHCVAVAFAEYQNGRARAGDPGRELRETVREWLGDDVLDPQVRLVREGGGPLQARTFHAQSERGRLVAIVRDEVLPELAGGFAPPEADLPASFVLELAAPAVVDDLSPGAAPRAADPVSRVPFTLAPEAFALFRIR